MCASGSRTWTSRLTSPLGQPCEPGLNAKSGTGRSSSTRRASSRNDTLVDRFYETKLSDLILRGRALRAAVLRLPKNEGWPRPRSRMWPSFEDARILRQAQKRAPQDEADGNSWEEERR